jgi:hypothetical protein
MGRCNLCGAEQQFPYECTYCGGTFCAKHKLPVDHLCRVVRENNPEEPTNSPNTAYTDTSPYPKPPTAHHKRPLKKIALAALALALVALLTVTLTVGMVSSSNSKDVSDAYQSGYRIGFHNGQQAAPTSSPVSTPSNGDPDYAVGFSEGNSSGYQLGYDEGYDKGYTKGLSEKNQTGYYIKDPSLDEVKAFIATDKTDEHPYNIVTYNCYDFTNDFCNHAFEEGYRCGSVYIEFVEYGHAIACFNTTDHGIVYIEPQNDQPVRLKIGVSYSDLALFEPADFDDTILSYDIIW